MRLDAEVKKEEIRAKNQFQMDKLMAEEQKEQKEYKEYKNEISGSNSFKEDYNEPLDEKTGRERLRY